MTLPLVTNPAQVEAGIIGLNGAYANLKTFKKKEREDLVQALPRARAWIAIQRNGKWRVGFAKYVGYQGQTPPTYAANRVNMSGTEAERAIKRLGGTAYPIGPAATASAAHPAIDAVRKLCAEFGKQPNSLAEVFVLAGEEVPEAERGKIDMVLASIKAAGFSKEAFNRLFEKAKAL